MLLVKIFKYEAMAARQSILPFTKVSDFAWSATPKIKDLFVIMWDSIVPTQPYPDRSKFQYNSYSSSLGANY
jgi:hypothetical protein